MQLPKELKVAIDNNAFCAISTHTPNGEVQTHLMWIDYKDNQLIINTEKDRKKAQNIRSNNSISLVIFHPEAMYSSWEVRGEVVEIIEDISANDHIDEVSIRYTGKPYRRELNEPWSEDIKSREMWIISVSKLISMIRPQAKSESE
jgi:hypothetical protein